MKKHITFALLFAAALTAQAQQGGISGEMLNQIKQSYKATPADKAIRNALGGTSINTLALNQENRADFDTEFSHKVLSKGITDQQSSGRCWLFTGLNVLRSQMIAKYGLDEMEFSQNYCFFYDQLEKANFFLQGIIDTSGKPMDDKMVEWLFPATMPTAMAAGRPRRPPVLGTTTDLTFFRMLPLTSARMRQGLCPSTWRRRAAQ